jgi:hypothetical protein
MVYVLVGAIGVAAAVGVARSYFVPPSTPPAPAAAPEQAAAPVQAQGKQAPQAPGAGPVIEGEVLEAIEVPNYSYLRIGQKGQEGSWVAVPTAQLVVGQKARVVNPMKMQDFKSTALKRTFPVIFFGTLTDGAAPHGMDSMDGKPNPHAADGNANGADPHATGAAPGADPHAQAGKGPADVKPVPKAEGPNGKTVAEAIGQRTQLSGKQVRIRATVVKATTGVMNKTWLHLRDGSGDQAAGTNDITVTTDATPAVGDVVVIEGVLNLDKDIGSGYKFATIIEDAKVVQ